MRDGTPAFSDRHIGPNADERAAMLDALGYSSMEAFMAKVVPSSIRSDAPLQVREALSETEAIERLAEFGAFLKAMYATMVE